MKLSLKALMYKIKSNINAFIIAELLSMMIIYAVYHPSVDRQILDYAFIGSFIIFFILGSLLVLIKNKNLHRNIWNALSLAGCCFFIFMLIFLVCELFLGL